MCVTFFQFQYFSKLHNQPTFDRLFCWQLYSISQVFISTVMHGQSARRYVKQYVTNCILFWRFINLHTNIWLSTNILLLCTYQKIRESTSGTSLTRNMIDTGEILNIFQFGHSKMPAVSYKFSPIHLSSVCPS